VPPAGIGTGEWRNAGSDTKNYDAIGEKLRSEGKLAPEGLLVHTAGFDGDTFRILEVWKSREQHDRFLSSRPRTRRPGRPRRVITSCTASPGPVFEAFGSHPMSRC
jgi:hypothetical protein